MTVAPHRLPLVFVLIGLIIPLQSCIVHADTALPSSTPQLEIPDQEISWKSGTAPVRITCKAPQGARCTDAIKLHVMLTNSTFCNSHYPICLPNGLSFCSLNRSRYCEYKDALAEAKVDLAAGEATTVSMSLPQTKLQQLRRTMLTRGLTPYMRTSDDYSWIPKSDPSDHNYDLYEMTVATATSAGLVLVSDLPSQMLNLKNEIPRWKLKVAPTALAPRDGKIPVKITCDSRSENCSGTLGLAVLVHSTKPDSPCPPEATCSGPAPRVPLTRTLTTSYLNLKPGQKRVIDLPFDNAQQQNLRPQLQETERIGTQAWVGILGRDEKTAVQLYGLPRIFG